MKIISARARRFALVAALSVSAVTVARSQSAFGVDGLGNLFNFDLSSPATTTTVGNLGFVPEGIDFRTGTSTLFAIDVGAVTTRLFTVDVNSGAATAIGAGFATTGSMGGLSYDLSGANSFGFDFNPTTLQPDGSIRIRLTASNGTNLRLNSATGGIAAVDGLIAGSIGAVAYINNATATIGGTTVLYDIDFQNNSLFRQDPPNAGTLVAVGPLGFNVGSNLGFDILSFGSDPTIAGDLAYFVDSIGVNMANLYSLNLGTGAATSLGAINRDFTGGFAIATPVPEPSTYGFAGVVTLIGLAVFKRRAKTARLVAR